ncbi:MAG: type II toxin-antitoxin system VapC family toxin [Planctomycetaceae bacterium]
MIYLDTSLLAKLHVREADSGAVVRAIGGETRLVVSDLALVEFCAAVWRRQRERKLTRAQARKLEARIRASFDDYDRVAVSREVVERGATIVGRHGLRTLDAIQLASALLLAERAPEPLRFGSADDRLTAAARAAGLPPLL